MLGSNTRITVTDQSNAPSETLDDVIGGLQSFNEYVDYAFSKPKEVLETIYDYINYILSVAPLCCACCLCTTLTATVAVVSIAVGVGIGVGVGCTETDYVYTNSTSG